MLINESAISHRYFIPPLAIRFMDEESQSPPDAAGRRATTLQGRFICIADTAYEIASRRPGDREGVIVHTDVAIATADLPALLSIFSRPAAQESAPLGFDPDDYPLF